MTDDPAALIAAGFARDEDDHARRRRLAAAEPFTTDERAERLLALRQTDPKQFDELPTSLVLALGHYEAARDRHQEATR